MIGVLGFHRSNHTQIVDNTANVRKQITDFDATFAARLKVPVRFFQKPFEVARFSLPIIDRDLFAVIGEQLRFGIERVDVRDAACHEQKDDPFHLGLKVARFCRQGVGSNAVFAGLQLFGQDALQSNRAEAACSPFQYFTSRCGHRHVSSINKQEFVAG